MTITGNRNAGVPNRVKATSLNHAPAAPIWFRIAAPSPV